MENQAYALVKYVKSFIIYILHSQIIAYVPTSVVKDILVQPDNQGKRGRWIAKILEYDLEIRPTKIIECYELARLLAESNYRSLQINSFECLDHHDSRRKGQESRHVIGNMSGIRTFYFSYIAFNV